MKKQPKKPQHQTVDLYGNLGGDPVERTIPAKTVTKNVYDNMIDEVVEKTYETRERYFLTFSLATGGYGDKPTRWHNVVDWEGIAFQLRQGDRIRATGHFEDRTYKKDGEEKTARQFVLHSFSIERLKSEQAA